LEVGVDSRMNLPACLACEFPASCSTAPVPESGEAMANRMKPAPSTGGNRSQDAIWLGREVGTWAKSRHDATLSGRLVAGQRRPANAFRLAGAARAWEQGERMGLKRAVEFAVALHPE
jgi:hypothetical protein